jgi:hypothetical protein
MTVMQRNRRRAESGLATVAVWFAAAGVGAGQGGVSAKDRAEDAAAFRDFSVRPRTP